MEGSPIALCYSVNPSKITDMIVFLRHLFHFLLTDYRLLTNPFAFGGNISNIHMKMKNNSMNSKVLESSVIKFFPPIHNVYRS